jgi:glutamate synthase domain-containing protein 3
VNINADGMDYRTLNSVLREAIAGGAGELTLNNVCGHRYIGAGLASGTIINVHGTAGNNVGCFMAGARLILHGNAQDGVANTMSAGEIIIHGCAGDVLGYAMRGGRVFVRGDAGYRVGIHMKAFKDCVPVVIIGGKVGDYFGEYMAGGTLVALGLESKGRSRMVGNFFGTGMHGGEIYIRGPVEEQALSREIGIVGISDSDWTRLAPHLADFAVQFGVDRSLLARERFTRLAPVTHRPYGKIYAY